MILGKAKVLEKSGSYLSGIEQLNHAIVLYPRFLPALIEKMKLQAALKDWEQVIDSAHRALSIDKHCLEPQRYLIVYNMAWESNDDLAIQGMVNLLSSLEVREPKNAFWYYETGRLFARLADKNKDILTHSLALLERAVFLEPLNIDYNCELGYQCMLMGRMSDAQRHYRNTTKMHETDIKGLTGLLHCQLLENQKGVEEQLESLEEFHKATDMSAVCSM